MVINGQEIIQKNSDFWSLKYWVWWVKPRIFQHPGIVRCQELKMKVSLTDKIGILCG